MPSDYEGFRRGLLEVARLADKAQRVEPSFLGRHLKNKPGLSAEALDGLLPSTFEGQFEIPPPDRRHTYFQLPPLYGMPRLCCLMAVRWNFAKEIASRGSFRLFFVNEKVSPPPDSSTFDLFVVRLDDQEDAGAWRFVHAQVCDKVEPYDSLFSRNDYWVPATIPRVPLGNLDSSAESMLVCVMASLYGTRSPFFKTVVANLLGRGAKALAERLSKGGTDG